MNDKFEILAASYLSGELNSEEKERFEEKLKNDTKLQKEFEVLSKYWNQMKYKQFDTDSAWDSLSQRIENEKPVKRKKLSKNALIGIAASSILVFGLLALLLAEFLPGNNQLKYFADQRMEITLPDNSKVILLKESKLTLDEHFNGKTRTVNLKGNGWFEVQPNKEVPFIIEAARCEVHVVGTKFSIDSRPEVPDKIVVKSGEVQVKHKFSDQVVDVHASENVWLSNDEINQNVQMPANYLSWVTYEFYYTNTPLDQVCAEVNQAYVRQIKLEVEHASNLKLSATFKGQTIEEIAKIIAQTHNLKLDEKENIIVLSK
jgi:ferric-dicitrate binding protein FerR (iron transport regulator)